MSNRSYLHCVLKASDCTVCVVDVSRGDETTQAHVFTTRGYARLTATPGDGSFTLGEAIPIRIRQPQRLATPASGTQPRIYSACWDPYSNSMLAAIGTCVVQLAENGDRQWSLDIRTRAVTATALGLLPASQSFVTFLRMVRAVSSSLTPGCCAGCSSLPPGGHRHSQLPLPFPFKAAMQRSRSSNSDSAGWVVGARRRTALCRLKRCRG